ncbi:hypothetical protein [Candidatus Nitrosocosmicus arcticus]|nr:hypothetical protein [Candidatus Nitrosocosmicus arcticus]
MYHPNSSKNLATLSLQDPSSNFSSLLNTRWTRENENEDGIVGVPN